MLSCDEINAAIAKQRGECFLYGRVRGSYAYGGAALTEPPDYCHDWAAAGRLLEDLYPENGWSFRLRYYAVGWSASVAFREQWRKPWKAHRLPALTEAIARAYHAAFCKEE